MKRAVASMFGLLLAGSGVAHAEDPPDSVAPFLTGEEDNVHTATGAFGPAKDTTVVITFSLRGRGTFTGFALVPDPKAKHGQRKLRLPRLPTGSMDGEVKTALVANLDKDPDDELVLAFHVMRGSDGPEGGDSYGAIEYVVLDWNGKQLVRVPKLERQLGARMAAREAKASELRDDELRAALGIAKK